MAVEFGLLGELRLMGAAGELPLGGAHQRALIARLVVSANESVPRDRLVEDLYPRAGNGVKALQVAVSRLRDHLAGDEEMAGRLETRRAGYRLRVDPGELDVDRLDRLLGEGAAALTAADAATAASRLREAVQVCRGPALVEFSEAEWAQPHRERLEERRLQALELCAEAELSVGIDAPALADLIRLVAHNPERERLAGVLMRALYRAGRQADALAVYRRARRYLVEEHGIEPGLELRELHQAILIQDLGLTAPVPVRVESVFGTAPAGPGEHAFVGRGTERRVLEGALERCLSGQRVAALVEGEPGIGKSRLAAEVVARARARGFTVLSGRCDEHVQRPFGPFVAALDDDFVVAPARPARVLGADPTAAESVDMPSVGIAGSRQYSLFASVSDRFAHMGRAAPVLLLLEDLQWADQPTLLLLAHLLTTPAAPRVMVLATYRRGDLGEGHPLRGLLADLHRYPGVLRLELEGLLDAEVAQLVGGHLGQDGGGGSPTVSALRRATGGNPFFLTEILRSLAEIDGDLEQHLGTGEGRSLRSPLPGTVREAISGRVARLSELVAEGLRTAAVLGAEFDVPLLAQLLGHDADELIRVGSAAGLIHGSGERMAFRHALIAQTLYDEIPAPRRRELHVRAARAIEAWPDLDVPGLAPVLARHWLRASRPPHVERAVHWCRQAAEQALNELAPQRAVRWYEQALELHARQADPSRDERCALLIGLGAAQRHSGEAGFRGTLLEAARLAHRGGDTPSLIRAVLGNTRGFVSAVGDIDHERIAVLEQALEAVGQDPTPERARLLATLASELSFSGEWDRRLTLSDEALRIARHSGDLGALVYVLTVRNFTIWCPETLAERFANTGECRAAADLLGDPLAQFHALFWRASACVQCGEFAEARACRERARRIAERIRHPLVLWMSAYDDADEHLIAGRIEQAEERALAAAEIGQAMGQPDAPLNLAAGLIVIRYDQGRLGELTDLIAQTIESNPRLTGFRSVLATALCEQRRYAEAAGILALDAPDRFADLANDLSWLSVTCMYAHVAARLLPLGAVPLETAEWLREMLIPWQGQIAYLGPMGGRVVAHHLGELELALGDLAAARDHLQAALRRAELLPAPVWALRSRIELVRCHLEMGDAERARELLEQSVRDADALGCQALAHEARALMAASR